MNVKRAVCFYFIITTFLLAPMTSLYAQSFIDDFSNDQVSRSNFKLFIHNIANPDTVATHNGSELEVSIEHSDPTNLDEEATFQIKSSNIPDLITSTGMFTGERPSTGTVRYDTRGNFFNRIQDGGPNPESREGDVVIDLIIRLAANPADDLASYCISERDSENNGTPLNGVESNCGLFNTIVEINTPYTFTAGIDRDTNQIIAQLNEERIVVDYEGAFFEPQHQNSKLTQFRLREGADSGSFSYSSVIFNNDDQVALQEVANPSPYRQDDFDFYDDDPTRSKEIIDGQLKLSATNSDIESDNTSQLRFRKNSDFIGGDLTYSSESVEDQTAEGFQSIRLSGLLYNDVSADVDADLTGSVFAAVSLVEQASSELAGEYCLLRSNDDSFDTTIDIADGLDDGLCPFFDLPIAADTSYPASIELDVEGKTVTFTLGEEQKTINVTSDIYIRESDTLRAQARIGFGGTGTIVGFVDNLTNSADLFNTASPTNIVGTGEGGTNDTGASSSGGGGCTIGEPGTSSGFMLLMAALATLLLLRRRVHWLPIITVKRLSGLIIMIILAVRYALLAIVIFFSGFLYANDEPASQLNGLQLGVGIAFTYPVFDRNNPEIISAEIDGNNIVRVTREAKRVPKLVLESHYFFSSPKYLKGLGCGEFKTCGHGPYIAIEAGSGSNTIDAYSLGYMVGFKVSSDQSSSSRSWNIGFGYVARPEVQFLGDGIKENMAVPENDKLRYKTESQAGIMIITSFTF